MKRRKGSSRRTKRRSVEVMSPLPSQPVIPSPEAPNDLRIGVSLIGKYIELPKGLNRNDAVVIITGDDKRTDNVIRIILATSGVLVVVVGTVSMLLIFALDYRTVGTVGLASAVVAGIITATGRLLLRKKKR
jgi:hypothetical protein